MHCWHQVFPPNPLTRCTFLRWWGTKSCYWRSETAGLWSTNKITKMPVFTPSLWKQAMCCLTLMVSLMLMTPRLASFFLQHVADILIKVPFRISPFRCCFCQFGRMCSHVECMPKELIYLSFIPLQLFPGSRWERVSAVEVICVCSMVLCTRGGCSAFRCCFGCSSADEL